MVATARFSYVIPGLPQLTLIRMDAVRIEAYDALMRDGDEAQRLAERWRVAGLILRRINPVAFEAWLAAAEVIAAETPEVQRDISFTDYVS